jgi:integrase
MTVYRRGKTWVGTFQHRGERIWIGSHPTKKAALAAENRMRRDLEGLSPETFEGWARRWLRDYARPAPATRKTYAYAVERLVDEFGTRPLASIDRMEARAAAQRLPSQPMKIARAMLNDAIDAGLVRANPFAGLRLEQSRGRKDLHALTEDEIVELADAALTAFDDAYGLVMRSWVLVGGFTGIRPGESTVLEWSHVSGDEILIEGTKTQTARRRIVLPPIAAKAITEAPRWFDSPWVFVSKTGKQFSKGIWQRYFDKVRTSYGRPDLDPYDLRHACATNLMRRGVEPWAIAQQLGHSDHGHLVTTLYGHPSEDDARLRIKRAYGQNVTPLAARLQQRRSEGVS